MYDSTLTSATWVRELLNGRAMWFYQVLGMAKPVFLRLCHELENRCGLLWLDLSSLAS